MQLKSKARFVAVLGMLAAMSVIAAEMLKVTIVKNVLELSLGFLPLAVTGMLFGPVAAMLVGAVSDIIGALIFSEGDFYFGFTLTAVLTGLFYGLLLHPQADGKKRLLRVLAGQGLVSLVCFAGLNTLWAWQMGYGRSTAYIQTRLIVNLVAFPIYSAVIWVIWRYRSPLERAVKY